MRKIRRLMFVTALVGGFAPLAAQAAPAVGSVLVTGTVPVSCRSAPSSPSFVTCNNPGAFVLRTVLTPSPAAQAHAASQSAVAIGKRVIVTPQI